VDILDRSRELGFLGPGPPAVHVEHAQGVASVAEEQLGGPPSRFLDLGSGGGVPGLILARRWAEAEVVLLDSSQRRTAFLRSVCAELGLGDRVEVLQARAEVAGRDPDLRGRFPLVVARSFGPPSVTAECGVALLAPAGLLLVTEPPSSSPDRWPAAGLALLGLAPVPTTRHADAHVQVLQAVQPCPDRYPRRTGVPAKRPLF
jgi:16S rRNA (guanine527-N7)-methyltransferase